jgi:hypothetical protein
MKIKDNFTIESAAEVLKRELSSYIKVTVRTNLLDSEKKWIDIEKDSFVGLRVTFHYEGIDCRTFVPGFFARMFFGGIISGIFHHNSRNDFKKQVGEFIISKFYE